jgi:hypothetical protein
MADTDGNGEAILPEGWRGAKLEDVLPKEAIKEVKKFLSRKGPKPINELRQILNKYGEELERNSVDPDYLAYYLQYRFKF